MRKIIGLLVLLLGLSPLVIHADRGSIPFKSHVKVFEPNQRAMIAWNGQEEILLLTTDLKASEPTKVLEVIPLPSEPVVKKGDIEVFQKAAALINSKIKQKFAGEKLRGVRRGLERPPAGEVTFHERIGAHEISVAHVLRGDGFIEWVEKYLKTDGVENPVIPDVLKEVVQEYIEEGFVWFVFDVVSLDTEPQNRFSVLSGENHANRRGIYLDQSSHPDSPAPERFPWNPHRTSPAASRTCLSHFERAAQFERRDGCTSGA